MERIKNLSIDDVLKIGSVVGLAFLIKPLLSGNQEVQAKVRILKSMSGSYGAKVATVGIPSDPFFGMVGETIVSWVASQAGVFTEGQLATIKKDIEQRDLENWILAFVIAVLIVQFGPDLLHAVGGIGKLGLLLLG